MKFDLIFFVNTITHINNIRNVIKTLGLKIFKIENIKVHGRSLRYHIIKEKNKFFKIYKSYKPQIQNEKKFKLDKFSSRLKFEKNINKVKKNFVKFFIKLRKILIEL